MARPLSPLRATTALPPPMPCAYAEKLKEIQAAEKSGVATKRPVFYIESLGERLKPDMRRLFQSYSGIPSAEVEAHLYAARKAAWQIHPYPCLGMWAFLNPTIRHLRVYPSILSLASSSSTFKILDVGCGLGQDVRQLVFDGVSPEKVYATDIAAGLWKAGMGLWKDEGRMEEIGGFRRGNILDLQEEEGHGGEEEGENCLAEWEGMFDVVYGGNLLHLFKGAGVVTAAANMLRLTKPGGWVVAYQIGGQGKWPIKDEFPGHVHNGDSWREVWRDVEEATGVQADAETLSSDFAEWKVVCDDIRWFPPGSCAFEMVAKRRDG